MPPVYLKPVGVTKKTAPASFFTPKARSSGRNTNRPDYATLERREAMPQNPPQSNTAPKSTPTSTNESPADTINKVAQPGDPNFDSDEDMAEPPEPTFANTTLTVTEKMEAIKKWAAHKAKHTRKKKDKNSHVYYYMKRETLHGCLYEDKATGIKCLQEYRWRCGLCLADPAKNWKPYEVMESKRHGATSGMVLHLKQHRITAEVHFARMRGYDHALASSEDTELDSWSGKKLGRLTAKEATRR
jgi:hypothetical protein